jgi:cell division protein FtsW
MAKKLAFDKVLFTAVCMLVAFGLAMVYSASGALARDHGSGANPFLVKQALAAALGFAAMWVVMHADYRLLRRPGVVYTLVVGALALLVTVLFAPKLNNTRRWFFVGGLSVQPSELAKLALVPFLAYQLEKKEGQVNSRDLLVPCSVVAALMAGLVLLEPDMGTAALLVASTVILLFLAGLAWRWLAIGLAAALPVVAWVILAADYRRERLLAFLSPESDPLGSGFQALQSLIAVGSGGVLGLGPGQSMQKLYFLPYPHSDFIFAIVAEELGIIGALALVGLFLVVLWRGARAGLRSPDPLGRYLAWGFTAMLVLQALINVSVALALLPTKGIPLPFISYGGSSLVVSMTACGVLLNVSQHG